jgi:hypothetical protein
MKNPKTLHGLVLLLGLFVSVATATAQSQFLRRDYYLMGSLEKQNIDPACLQTLDEIICFKPVTPDAQGHLVLDGQFLSQLATLKEKKAPATKLCLGVGSLANIQTNPAAIEVFAKDLTALCAKHGFASVDLGWQGEMNPKAVYEPTVRPIIEKLHAAKLKAYMYSTPWSYSMNQAKSIADIVDAVHIGYYGAANAWALYEFEPRVDAFVQAGIAKGKIFIGLPLFGHGGKAGELGFASLIKLGANPDENEFQDSKGNVFRYNGRPLIKEKVEYAKRTGLGGVFTWVMNYDGPYGSESSLLAIIDAAAGKQPAKK